jgi:PhnB protein
MKTLNPYLNFAGDTEEAFEFYRTVFGGDFLTVVRFKDFRGMGGMELPAEDLEKIGHIALPLGEGHILMGTDVLESMGQSLTVGNNSHIALEADTPEEADRLFAALSERGSTQMPLQKTDWAEKYGSCADRYGVHWMVSFTGDVRFGGGSAAG